MKSFVIRFLHNDVAILFLLCIVGIFFRLWIAQLVPQPFINDQRDYDWFASKILKDPYMLGSHSFRSYPYPLFIAVMYRFAGFANHEFIFLLQAVMDTCTGLLLFYILKKGFQKKYIAYTGLLLYLFNPFTAGYVNVVLAEVMTTFFIALTIATGIVFINQRNWYWGILLGLFAGIGAETRNAAFLWTGIPFVLLLLYVPIKKYVISYVAIGIGVFLAVIYPLYTNWRDYHEINITTVDSFYAKEFFNGAIIKILPPLGPPLPQETYAMYYEYYSEYFPDRDGAYRKAIAQKYYGKAWEIIKKDPVDYIRTRFFKMWYVWQKEAIYTYVEPGFERHKFVTYFINLSVLALTLVGLIVMGVNYRNYTNAGKWVYWCIIGTLLYGTIVFCVTHAEHRLTIPFYPLLYSSVAIPVSRVFKKIYTLWFSEK